ncbi:MAG: hypothetical protein H8E21_16480 [Gammaproteobacteria bacterium]|nr:hypothetical protein [Gammaproteobacteria bacterium]MBL6999951.1 hypothetical protein [Gammaproteobacteria bacterium]
MQLSNEDNLRLNVLLAQDLKAVRIDESKMIVYALSSRGDAKIQLNPTGKDEKYIRLVKELLSNKIMGSPGGYPVYIKRWTRMGQERQQESLAQLLLLGEPEAVVAVVHAPTLSTDIARHAWWAFPSSENARRLLEKKSIVDSDLARELVEFLLEFLPFEIEHRDMIDSVRLCLQNDLLTAAEIDDLWKRARRKQSLYVGFLHSQPDALPDQAGAHPLYKPLQQSLQPLVEQGNVYAIQLLRYLSEPGQGFLRTIIRVLEKAASQDTIVSLFQALSNYNRLLPLASVKQRDIKNAEQLVTVWISGKQDEQLVSCLEACAQYSDQIRAMLVISQLDEVTLFPIFGLTDALGTVMRKKLEPVTGPLLQHIRQLLH